MTLESGAIIFIGLLLLFIKLPSKTALRLLNYPLLLDLAVSAAAYVLHWGTFTGVMAAAVAGLMCSGFTLLGRALFGYIASGTYHPGYIKLRL